MEGRMNHRWATVMFIVFLLIFIHTGILFNIEVRAADVVLPFDDGFENITDGEYPSANGWFNIFAGQSAKVTSAISNGGTKSFRLSSFGWARTEGITLSMPDRLKYSADVYLESMTGNNVLLSFEDVVSSSSSYGFNCVMFVPSTQEIKCKGENGTSSIALQSFIEQQWYHVEVTLDFINNKMNVTIDGTQKATDITCEPKITSNTFAVGVSDTVAFFDNVRLEEINPSTPPTYPPSVPRNLDANAGDGQATLSWDAPSSDGGASITSYAIYRGLSSGSKVKITTIGNTLTHLDTGLTNGQIYYYQVTAINSVGEGDLSNEVSLTPQSSIAPPNIPALYNSDTPDDDGDYSFYWSDVSGAMDYNLQEKNLTGSYVTVYTGSNIWYRILGNLDGTYSYRVNASNSAGFSGWSNVVDILVEIDSDDDGVPDYDSNYHSKRDVNNDNDGIYDNGEYDEFPADDTEWVDTDGDGIGNNADTDNDNDGVLDDNDEFPLDSNETMDTDNDGIGNSADLDDDGDLVPDLNDSFPLDPSESLDTDEDGIGNNADTDDDGDTIPDNQDLEPLIFNNVPNDENINSIPWWIIILMIMIVVSTVVIILLNKKKPPSESNQNEKIPMDKLEKFIAENRETIKEIQNFVARMNNKDKILVSQALIGAGTCKIENYHYPPIWLFTPGLEKLTKQSPSNLKSNLDSLEEDQLLDKATKQDYMPRKMGAKPTLYKLNDKGHYRAIEIIRNKDLEKEYQSLLSRSRKLINDYPKM